MGTLCAKDWDHNSALSWSTLG